MVESATVALDGIIIIGELLTRIIKLSGFFNKIIPSSGMVTVEEVFLPTESVKLQMT